MDGLEYGMPKTYKNRSGNDVTEWPDGLKLVRFADGRIKVGRQGFVLRGGTRGVNAQEFCNGNNATAHVIAAFDNPE